MNVLNLGIAETFFNAVANGAQNSTAFALPSAATQITWQTSFGSAPASVTLQLQTSNDNSTWSTIDTSTSTAGESRTINTSANFIRARENAVSGGSTTTVIVTCKAGFIAGANLAFSGNVSIGGNISIAGSLAAAGLSYPAIDGTDGQVLTTDGAGTLSFETPSGGGGTPSAPSGSLQYNNSGAFGGSANATLDSNGKLTAKTYAIPTLTNQVDPAVMSVLPLASNRDDEASIQIVDLDGDTHEGPEASLVIGGFHNSPTDWGGAMIFGSHDGTNGSIDILPINQDGDAFGDLAIGTRTSGLNVTETAANTGKGIASIRGGNNNADSVDFSVGGGTVIPYTFVVAGNPILQIDNDGNLIVPALACPTGQTSVVTLSVDDTGKLTFHKVGCS